MPESIKMALLQNPGKDIPHLSIVETLDEFTSTACGDGSFTHLSLSMLVSDMMPPKHQHPLRGEMYMQLLVPRISILLINPRENHFSQDIDTPPDDFYQVHQTKHSRKPPTPLSGFQKDHPRKSTRSTPKKPFKKYDGPVYVPAEVYRLLP